LFPTLFYIFILLYQNLYSGLGFSFNAEVDRINLFIKAKDYLTAIALVNNLEKKNIFFNENLARTKILLTIKQPTSILNVKLKTPDDYVFKSIILGQNNQQENSVKTLRKGLKLYPEQDTLTKLFELFSFINLNKLSDNEVFPSNRLKEKRIYTLNESKWMLEL
jgi:hypothetical protein